jgi:hypothetical protein
MFKNNDLVKVRKWNTVARIIDGSNAPFYWIEWMCFGSNHEEVRHAAELVKVGEWDEKTNRYATCLEQQQGPTLAEEVAAVSGVSVGAIKRIFDF